MSRQQQRTHGSGVVAPDEGFASGESPAPGAVQAKGVHGRSS